MAPKFDDAYEEKSGDTMPLGLNLVTIKEAVRSQTRVKKERQINLVYHNAAGEQRDYIPVSAVFRVKQIAAAVVGKAPEDITPEKWGEQFEKFNNLDGDEGVDAFCEWLKSRGVRPFFVTVLERKLDNGNIVREIGRNAKQRISRATETEAKDYRAPGETPLPRKADDAF